jgi:hypothetical protein
MLALAIVCGVAYAQSTGGAADLVAQEVPNVNQQITPLAPNGSQFVGLNPGLADDPSWMAQDAATTVVSPDHQTLLILTSGYNRHFTAEHAGPYPWNIGHEPERRAGQTYDRHLQHIAERLELYGDTFGVPLQHATAAASQASRDGCAEAGARGEVLGAGYQGNGLLG